MHPAQHRGLRELYVMARQLRDHWRELAGRLEAGAPEQAQLLHDGSELARALLGELPGLTASRGLHGRPAAQGLGAQLAKAHSQLLDTSLEVNQALRVAVLDAVHVATLLDYLAGLAAYDDDADLQGFLADWAARLTASEVAVRAAAVELGDDPDGAVEASTPGLAGELGHGAAHLIGTLGEWVDGRYGR